MTRAKRSTGLRFQPAGGKAASGPPIGKVQALEIDRLSHDGRGLARDAGRTWLVSGALPGERVKARVLAARSGVVEARCEQVLSAAAERRQPPCPLVGRCGGCTLQHMSHDDQLALKQRALAEQLQRTASLVPAEWAPPLRSAEFAYRRRARLAVRWDPARKHLAVGFRAAFSQDIVDLDACPVLVQPLQQVLHGLPAVLRQLSRPRALGHVELLQAGDSAILVRLTEPLPDQDRELLRAYSRELGAQLWWQEQDEPTPDAPGQAPLAIPLNAQGLDLHCRPGDFVQVNETVNESMVAQALRWLAPQQDERILDLFCGLGNFSLPLAQCAQQVVAVEGSAAMAARGAENARRQAVDNLHAYQADLFQPLADADWAQGGYSAVVLDPPRDGALEVARGMHALGARRVLYVSCNPATLARDAAELARQGYRLERAGLLDMFPQTAHIEAMLLFTADSDARPIRRP